MTHGQLESIVVGAEIQPWLELGFVGESSIVVGSTHFRFAAGSAELGDAAIVGIEELDGLSLAKHDASPAAPAVAPEHPNGVIAIDHVVVMTPHPDRTTGAFEAGGIEARRVRVFDTKDGERRQTFFWLGDVICEVVGAHDATGSGDSTWWGLALTVNDLDATCDYLGDLVSEPRTAVQPGRRVATVKRSAGLSVPVLLISPHCGGQSE